MADVRLTIYGIDKASATFRKIQGVGAGAFNKIKSAARGLKSALFSVKGAIAAIGVGLVAKSFVDAASEMENYKIQLAVLTRSQEKANKVFDDMSKFAGNVTFEYKDIMNAATNLAGVMDGDIEKINKWMPLIADLSAARGFSIEETTSQIMRMYSAGAAAADMFRDRGVLAMLGFQQGVSYSAEETRRILFESWNKTDSQFKNAADKLAGTWGGLMGMFADKWLQFRVKVMESGPFQAIKNAASKLLDYLNNNADKVDQFAKDAGKAVIDYGKKFVSAIGIMAEATIMNGAGVIDWLREQRSNLDGLFLAISKIEEYTTKGLLLVTPEDSEIARALRDRLVEIKDTQAELYEQRVIYVETDKAIDGARAKTDALKSALDALSEIISEPTIDADDAKAKRKLSFIRIELHKLDKMKVRPQVIIEVSSTGSKAMLKSKSALDDLDKKEVKPKVTVEAYGKGSPTLPFSEYVDYMGDKLNQLPSSMNITADFSSFSSILSLYADVKNNITDFMKSFGPAYSHRQYVMQEAAIFRYKQEYAPITSVLGKILDKMGGALNQSNYLSIQNNSADPRELDRTFAKMAKTGRSEFARAIPFGNL